MKTLRSGTVILAFLLTACGATPQLPGFIPTVPATATPRVIAPTRTLLPASPSATSTTPYDPSQRVTPSPTDTGTPTLVSTEPATQTPTMPSETGPTGPLEVIFTGCNTSLDITHSMGEVTNVYITLRNIGSIDLSTVCITLSASDEERTHPDRSRCLSSLPAGYQILLKLTVDTGFQDDTAIQVDVIAPPDTALTVTNPSCKTIGFPAWAADQAGVLEPIP